MTAKPFVKWAGGKTQLLDRIDDVVGKFRNNSDQFIYVEPFVGGGSVLFHLLATCSNLKYAVINDSNSKLMNCYKVIASDVEYNTFKFLLFDIQERYNNCEDKKQMYLDIRSQYNKWEYDCGAPDAWGAVMFIFLNKCCFNGLYRVNSKGEFNVPWGQKEHLNIFTEDGLDACHIALSERVVIMCGDYKNTEIFMKVAKMENCDIIYYLDPPYLPVSPTQSFTSYTKEGFTADDQTSLKFFCDRINNNGGKFIVSNSNVDDFFLKLYNTYNIDVVQAKRNINSVGNKRGNVDELIIYNNTWQMQ